MLIRSRLLVTSVLVAVLVSQAQTGYYLQQEASAAFEDKTSECALILHRTYVDKTPAPAYGGFYNLIKPVSHGTGPTHEVCIKYSDVDSAFFSAKSKLNYKHPIDLDTNIEPALGDIAANGALILEVSTILAQQFHLSHDEILNGLPLIDVSRTALWDVCPAYIKPMPCTNERYRTYTSHCNNMQHPSWGATHTPFVRFLPPNYADGLQHPRVSVLDGSPLPSARLVTGNCHRDVDRPSSELAVLLMSWGQFIDHDLTLASVPRDERDLDFECCGIPRDQQHPSCLTIQVPRGDYFYGQYGQTCIEFKRLDPGHRPSCALGPRVHVNTLTAAIDANFIYGSTEELAKKLRLGKGGFMRMWDRFSDLGLKPLLPPLSENPDRDCIGRPRNLHCFLAGDERVNEQIHLTVLHTIYVRDHNRVAHQLGKLNPHWDDERIYQETRHILAAQVQHITYNEFLPMVLGEDMIHRYNLTLAKEGYWNGYDDQTHMGLSNAFQSAAFRFGHTHIQGQVRRYNKHHEYVGAFNLRDLLRKPFIVYEPGMMDELIGGLLNTPSQVYDPFITQEVTNHLFEEPNVPFGLDLTAINLQRGRETGVPGYNDFREWCGLPRAHSFSDLEPYLSNGTAFKYSKIYKHVDDIDLWSAGVSEYSAPGAIMGPTFACIVARQFANLKKGDRYWYENSGFPSAFTPEQMVEIRKTLQGKIICDNADDMPTTQIYVMRLPHAVYNPRVRCQDLPSLDFRFWKEDPINGGFPYKR